VELEDLPALITQILQILGILMVLAQAIVAITPGKSDDKKLEDLKKKKFMKILLNFLKNFAPIQKKPKDERCLNVFEGIEKANSIYFSRRCFFWRVEK